MSATNIKTLVSRPTHLGRKPRTAGELLRQTHTFLEEEGRWIKGHMFMDGDAKRAYEQGFCNNWGACSVGALGIVAGDYKPAVEHGVAEWDNDDVPFNYYHWQTDYDIESDVVFRACAYLTLVISPQRAADALDDGTREDDPYKWVKAVIDWNDAKSRRRKQVLAAFAKAAELASKRGSFKDIAEKYLAEKKITASDPWGSW